MKENTSLFHYMSVYYLRKFLYCLTHTESSGMPKTPIHKPREENPANSHIKECLSVRG